MAIRPVTDNEILCIQYFCDYCKHRGREGTKKRCPLRDAMHVNKDRRSVEQETLIEKSITEDGCKWFESRDPNVKPPVPKDRDVSRVVRKHG